ncbi:MAG: corrinoid protein [Prolixibacteraceae bacterium]|jgi:methanogenic corrinoid protein MtbC1|nr:corrinoid protein [Prolixibacteraceae bacterium]MDI9562679.1 corrinoid protein [Bacteroidota bacterium]NLT00687.1 cobalamin-binding protein [Bacteroidales bacterium]OQB78846.1 MAG: Methionine synthase [Bacteroidetes bacterium ADurb.Bin123]HNU78276.1 corrinoid protein [Prolixibacteraceae bacterium]
MTDLLQKLSECVEFGKVNKSSPFPPQMKGEDGADEIARQLLDGGTSPQKILTEGLMLGMERVGIKFRENKVFVPQVLMSAKAMNTAMVHLKPYFLSGEARQKGTFIIGTVEGDLHDIGKNLVSMMVEGNGWKVVDLGVDVKADRFITALNENPGAFVGLSALLTTTMPAMERITKSIKSAVPEARVAVGGAPVTHEFCEKIGADVYSRDPQGLVEYLNENI